MYPFAFIEYDAKPKIRISKIISREYQKGLSLKDISIKLNRSKYFIRSCLLDEGIKLRDKFAQAMSERRSRRGKQGAKPFYGFCYFEGEIIKNPIEYSNLKMIFSFWREGKSAHQIVNDLNSRGLKSRTGKRWSWAAIKNIVERFESGLVSIED